MKITLTDKVSNWFEEELDVAAGDSIRFFVRYGGIGGRIPGFSLGITIETPDNIHASTSKNGVTYYIEEADEWYFEGEDLNVQFNEQLKEPQFSYGA